MSTAMSERCTHSYCQGPRRIALAMSIRYQGSRISAATVLVTTSLMTDRGRTSTRGYRVLKRCASVRHNFGPWKARDEKPPEKSEQPLRRKNLMREADHPPLPPVPRALRERQPGAVRLPTSCLSSSWLAITRNVCCSGSTSLPLTLAENGKHGCLHC